MTIRNWILQFKLTVHVLSTQKIINDMNLKNNKLKHTQRN